MQNLRTESRAPGDLVRERLQQLDAGEEFEEGSLLDQLLRSPHKIN